MSKKSRVFILGLDGATWDILRPFIEDGTMPNLGKMLQEGVSGVLESIIPPETAPAWTAFQTGVNPGKSGIFDFFNFDKEKKEFSLSNASLIKTPTIWEMVSQKGGRVISINVPMTYPPREVNGIIIGGIMSPRVGPEFVYPASLYNEIMQQAEGYKIMIPMPRYWVRSSELEKYITEQIEVEQTRLKLAFYLMDKYEWDLCMVHNQTLDTVQHSCWKYLDPGFPGFSPRLNETVKKFYAFIDDSIARIAGNLDEDDVFIIVSDHGFGPLTTAVELNCWLKKQGYLSLKKGLKTKLFYLEDIVKNTGFLRRIIRSGLTKFLQTFLRKSVVSAFFQARSYIIQQSIDWDKTKAIVTGGNPYANIYIISPQEQREKVKEELIKKLKSMRNPATGKCVVKEVYEKEKIYKGSFVPLAPDLVAEPAVGYVFYPTTNSLKLFIKEQRGTHLREGILVASGTNIKSSSRVSAHITDITPTVLSILDMEIPPELDGKVKLDIFKTPPAVKRGKTSGEFTTKEKIDYSSRDDEVVRKRLQDLGYL